MVTPEHGQLILSLQCDKEHKGNGIYKRLQNWTSQIGNTII